VIFDPTDYRIYEGSETNFYAVTKDGTLQTAPENVVLNGSMRKLTLSVCEKYKLPLLLECPKLNQIDNWTGPATKEKKKKTF